MPKVERWDLHSSSYMQLEHSPYDYFADAQQEGQLEVKERSEEALWTTTRSIVMTAPSLQEICGQNDSHTRTEGC